MARRFIWHFTVIAVYFVSIKVSLYCCPAWPKLLMSHQSPNTIRPRIIRAVTILTSVPPCKSLRLAGLLSRPDEVYPKCIIFRLICRCSYRYSSWKLEARFFKSVDAAPDDAFPASSFDTSFDSDKPDSTFQFHFCVLVFVFTPPLRGAGSIVNTGRGSPSNE